MKKIIYSLVIILIFLITPKVKAFNLGSDIPLSYGNSTYAYNWSSSSNFTGLTLHKSNGYDGGVFYTDTVTTGTNGISFGQFFNGMLLKNHYYRFTWVAYNNSTTSCSEPASWANQLRFGTGMYGSSIVTKTSFKYIGVQQNVNIYIDDPEATYSMTGCAYTIIISLGADATFANFPVNTSSSLSSQWNYYGFYMEDIGSTSEVTQTDLNNAITNMQNSITSNANSNAQNIINNQNQNAQQAHQDAQNTQNTIKDDSVNSNTGKSFFDGFTDNTHGLSGIITAPLTIINNFINISPSTCQPLSVTYHNKNVSFPCGSLLWSHSGVTDLNGFYNLVVGGAICYFIIKDLFLTIEKLKDPDNDKVEVMDL